MYSSGITVVKFSNVIIPVELQWKRQAGEDSDPTEESSAKMQKGPPTDVTEEFDITENVVNVTNSTTRQSTCSSLSVQSRRDILLKLSDTVQNNLLEKLHSATSYGLLIDDMSDVATIEQMICYVQYVDPDSNEVNTDFLFICNLLENSDSANSQTLVDVLCMKLKDLQMNVKKISGLCTAGASVMVEIVLAVPVSNAWPERGCSKVKIIKTDLRNRLKNVVLNGLMMISINGPQTCSHECDKVVNDSVKLMLGEKNRRKLPSKNKGQVEMEMNKPSAHATPIDNVQIQLPTVHNEKPDNNSELEPNPNAYDDPELNEREIEKYCYNSKLSDL
ncbi:unnamed protein product [Mytilus edulis]|uniref:Uncharacterized protein n=1 Tax=Mytilus edulis TaxID=6550 RepID=A0A8S3T8E5_MYTED|nr:unnamed protein product [Mytilus edulis]